MLLDIETKLEDAIEEASNCKDLDVETIKQQIADADGTNAKIRENAERRRLSGEADEAEAQSNDLTEILDKLDAEKAKALAEASFPVEGLAFDSDGVTYNGIPFEQSSSAEQLRISVAMGLALHNDLKVLLIRDGSLLDADSLRMVAEMATDADAQVWIERVSDGDEVTVIIEDGMVKDK